MLRSERKAQIELRLLLGRGRAHSNVSWCEQHGPSTLSAQNSFRGQRPAAKDPQVAFSLFSPITSIRGRFGTLPGASSSSSSLLETPEDSESDGSKWKARSCRKKAEDECEAANPSHKEPAHHFNDRAVLRRLLDARRRVLALFCSRLGQKVPHTRRGCKVCIEFKNY